MKRFTIKVLVWLVVVLIIVSIAIEQISEHVFHADALRLMVFLPIGFFLSGTAMMTMLNLAKKADDKKLLQIFLFIKMLKNFVVVVSGLFYELVVDVNFKVFLLTAGLYYLMYLIFETVVLFQFEKLLKKLNHE
jgi:hypothetical protein